MSRTILTFSLLFFPFFHSLLSVEKSGNIHFLETVIVDFPAHVVIKQSIVNDYEISGDNSSLKSLKVRVQGGKLIFEKRKDKKNAQISPIDIVVHARQLLEVLTFGDVDLDLEGIITQKLAIEVAGKGDITIKGLDALEFSGVFDGEVNCMGDGKIKEAEFFSHGFTKVDFMNIESKIMSIKAEGKGSYQVFCTDKLWAQLHGDIGCTYAGDPKTIESKLTGSSFLKKK